MARGSAGPLGSRCISGPCADPGGGQRRGPGAGEGVQEPSRGHGAEPQPPRFAPKVGPQGEARKGGTAFKYKSNPSVTGNLEKVAQDINRGYNCGDKQGCSCKYSLSFLIWHYVDWESSGNYKGGKEIKTRRRESSLFKPKISVLLFCKTIKGCPPPQHLYILLIYINLAPCLLPKAEWKPQRHLFAYIVCQATSDLNRIYLNFICMAWCKLK